MVILEAAVNGAGLALLIVAFAYAVIPWFIAITGE